MSGMLVGYITNVPEQETLQIGSVNLDDSKVVSIRLAPNQSTNLVFLYQRNGVLMNTSARMERHTQR